MVDIIMLATARVDNSYSSTAVSLAKEFAKKHRVFFIENPYTLKDILSNKQRTIPTSEITAVSKYAVEIQKNLWKIKSDTVLSINWLPEGVVYNLLSRINEMIFFKVVKKLLKDFDVKEFVLFNVFNPFYCKNKPDWFQPVLNVYYSVDSISDAKYFSKHGVQKEREVLEKYDIAFATSMPIYNKIKLLNSNSFYLPNGADFDLFNKALSEDLIIPVDLENIPVPRAIYIGNIDSRIDVTLIENLLINSPQINIVFIGPVNSKKIKDLKKYKNMVLLGVKGIELLPSYLKYCQCAIIPFVKNGFTKSIYPLKINEYLASGIPTVTTNFSDSMKDFENIISTCDSSVDFIEAVVEAVSCTDKARAIKGVNYASKSSWASRGKQFWNVVDTFER